MKALVFAAGLGTRLGPLTKEMPKALVPVGGEPMLGRVLRKLQAEGFRDVVVTACYKADMIERWLSDNPFPGMSVSLSVEPGPEPYETGGGIKFARPFLDDGEPFLVHNVDILSNADLTAFAAGGNVPPAANPLATLLVTDPRPQDNRFFLFRPDDLRLAGWTNAATGEVRGNICNPADYRRMSFCGIHMISPAIFPLLESWPERFSITDFYIKEAERQPIYGIAAPDLKIIDIGSPETLAEAERALS